MRDSFIFYRSFFEAINDLPEKEQLKVYKAICELSLNFKEIEMDGLSSTIFKLIKPQLEANNKRFINGQKGGAPQGNKNASKPSVELEEQPKNNQKTTKKQANNNDNVNVNDNDNVNDNIYMSFGEYKRVKLKQKQYDELTNNFGKEYINFYIARLDEYVESNNNKNKYKDFNLVLRKAIREKWFENKKEKNNKKDNVLEVLREVYQNE